MSPTTTKKQHDLSFYFFKWLIIILIAVFAFSLLTKPIRKKWANNYIGKGDSYLLQKKYESAVLEYDKALFLYWKNTDAKPRIALAKRASSNVLELEHFYREKEQDSQLGLIKKVRTLPEDETAAVMSAKTMIEQGEFQYAIIFAKNATEMDRGYRDAWLYLGIAYLDAGKILEIDSDAKKIYLDQAKTALTKAKNIDPEYKPTQDYLGELEKPR